jgi:Rod binding domain-containing protein
MVDLPASLQQFSGLAVTVPAASHKARMRESGAENTPAENPRLRAVAERFEAAFLAEMLRHSGLGRVPESFNGGAGEKAFAGSLVQEYANRIAATGSLGIAEQIYRDLVERSLK